MVFIVQVLKDELRHKILLESQHLFLQKGYDRTSLQMIADKVNISKSNLYHYFKNKEELFYELTDGAAEGLKRLIMRFRDKRFDPVSYTHLDVYKRQCFRSLPKADALHTNHNRFAENGFGFPAPYAKREAHHGGQH